MNISDYNSLNRKQIERAILKNAKKVIVQSSLNTSTRNGNKALEHISKRLAQQPLTMTAAIQLGENLGQSIVALSQEMGRQNLDQGVIRQLALHKLPSFTSALIPEPENRQDSPQDARAEISESEVMPSSAKPIATESKAIPEIDSEPQVKVLAEQSELELMKPEMIDEVAESDLNELDEEEPLQNELDDELDEEEPLQNESNDVGEEELEEDLEDDLEESDALLSEVLSDEDEENASEDEDLQD